MSIRNAKKILASLLAFSYITCTSLPAFAEDEGYEFYIKENGYEGVVTFDTKEEVYAYFGLLDNNGNVNQDYMDNLYWRYLWRYDDDYSYYNYRGGTFRDIKHYVNQYYWWDDDYSYGYVNNMDFATYLQKYYNNDFQKYLKDNYNGNVSQFLNQYYAQNFVKFLNDYLNRTFGNFFATNRIDTVTSWVNDFFSGWFSFFGFGWGHGRVYSDGHRSAHYTRKHFNDHLHYGLATGKGRLIADGQWYGDPTVLPDTVRPHGRGHREDSKDSYTELTSGESANGGIHKDTSSIDKNFKGIRGVFEQAFTTGEKTLAAASDLKDAQKALETDNLHLKNDKTLVNPEKAEKYLVKNQSEKVLSKEEYKQFLKDHPVYDIKTGDDLLDPEKKDEARKAGIEYMQKIRAEASSAYMSYMNEIKTLNQEMQKLNEAMLKNEKDTLANSQRAEKVRDLAHKIDVLTEQMNGVKHTVEQVQRQYEAKQEFETKSHQSAFMSYQAVDPYADHKDDETYEKTSKNFGIMKYDPSKFKNK